MDAPEEHLLQHGHCSHHSRLPSRGQRVHLHVGSNEGGSELGIGGSTGTTASNGFRDVMDLKHSVILNSASIIGRGELTHLLAILVCNDGAFCRTRVCTEDNAIFEDASDDGRSRARGFGQRQTTILEE